MTAASLTLALPAVVMALSANPGPSGCVVIDSIGRCVVAAVDPGRPGGPRDSGRGDERPARPRPRQEASGDRVAAPVPPPPPPLASLPLGDDGWVLGEAPGPGDYFDVLRGAEPEALDPAVLAQVLARQAFEQLTLAPPIPHMSTGETGFVGVPIWLWIDDDGAASAGPVSATATAGTASVTATGVLSAVEWSMGPPGDTVRCSGPGTPWTGQDGQSPDCGYVYEQRSLPERTEGTGRWTVTATSVWTVTWSGMSGGAPVGGQQAVRLSAETSLAVGEVQVLVSGGGA